MRHSRLHAAAHGIAHSLASGLSFLGGMERTTILADVTRGGPLLIDLLAGRVTGGVPSDGTGRAVARIDLDAHLEGLSPRAGRAMFETLTLTFSRDGDRLRCDVHLTDHEGRRSARRYAGPDLRAEDAPASPGGWLTRPGR